MASFSGRPDPSLLNLIRLFDIVTQHTEQALTQIQR